MKILEKLITFEKPLAAVKFTCPCWQDCLLTESCSSQRGPRQRAWHGHCVGHVETRAHCDTARYHAPLCAHAGTETTVVHIHTGWANKTVHFVKHHLHANVQDKTTRFAPKCCSNIRNTKGSYAVLCSGSIFFAKYLISCFTTKCYSQQFSWCT